MTNDNHSDPVEVMQIQDLIPRLHEQLSMGDSWNPLASNALRQRVMDLISQDLLLASSLAYAMRHLDDIETRLADFMSRQGRRNLGIPTAIAGASRQPDPQLEALLREEDEIERRAYAQARIRQGEITLDEPEPNARPWQEIKSTAGRIDSIIDSIPPDTWSVSVWTTREQAGGAQSQSYSGRIDPADARRIVHAVLGSPEHQMHVKNAIAHLDTTSTGLTSVLRTLAAEYGPRGVIETVQAMNAIPGEWEPRSQDRVTLQTPGYVARPQETPIVWEPAQAFAEVINRFSLENESNTPDFILGEFLQRVLADLALAVSARDKWYDVKLAPGWRTLFPQDGAAVAPTSAPQPSRLPEVWIVAESRDSCVELADMHHIPHERRRYIFDETSADRMRGFLLPYNAEEAGRLIVGIWPSDVIRDKVYMSMKLHPVDVPDDQLRGEFPTDDPADDGPHLLIVGDDGTAAPPDRALYCKCGDVFVGDGNSTAQLAGVLHAHDDCLPCNSRGEVGTRIELAPDAHLEAQYEEQNGD